MEYPKNVFIIEMAAVGLDLPPVSTSDVGGNTATVGPRWVKWRKAFSCYMCYIQAKAVDNDGQKNETLTDLLGPEVIVRDENGVVQDNATNFEKAMHTLNAHFVGKVSEPYERHVFRSMC